MFYCINSPDEDSEHMTDPAEVVVVGSFVYPHFVIVFVSLPNKPHSCFVP